MDNIELRSQEVREIIGKVPPLIIRFGISILFITITLLIVFSVFFEYPEYVKFPTEIIKYETNHSTTYITKIKIPAYLISVIKPNNPIFISLEQFPEKEFGYLSAYLYDSISNVYIENNLKYYYVFITLGIELKTNTGKVLNYVDGLSGITEIQTENKTIFQKIFSINLKK